MRIPHLASIHCIAHREALAVRDAADEVPELRMVDGVVRAFAEHIGRSSVHYTKFQNLQQIFCQTNLEAQGIHAVRWLSCGEAVQRLLDVLPAAIVVLKDYKAELYEVVTSFKSYDVPPLSPPPCSPPPCSPPPCSPPPCSPPPLSPPPLSPPIFLPASPTSPGHATTAHLLTWTFYLLAKHPEWQERLRAELKQALTQQGARDTSAATTGTAAAEKAGSEEGGGKPGGGNQRGSGGEGEEGEEGGGREGGRREGREGEGGGRVTWEVVAALKDMGMMLQESLRMFPPVPFMGRTCQQACRVGPYDLPQGIDVLIPVAMLHYDPRFWGPHTLDFNPDRFAKGLDEACSHPQAFLPFGSGPRICIGNNFALTEAKVVLAHILRRPFIGQALDLYRLTPPPASSSSSSASPSPDSPPSTHGPAVFLPRLHEWRQQYGDVFGFTIGGTAQLLVTDPALVLLSSSGRFTKAAGARKAVLLSSSGRFTKTAGARKALRLLGNGLPLSEGSLWARQRRIVNPAFRPAAIKGQSLANSWSNQLQQQREGNEEGVQEGAHSERANKERACMEVDVQESMSLVALDVIGLAAFGSAVMHEGGEEGGRLMPGDIGRERAAKADKAVAVAAGAGDPVQLYNALSKLAELGAKRVFSWRSLVPFYDILPLPENFALWAAEKKIRNLTLHLIGKRRAAAAAAVHAEEEAHGGSEKQQGGATGRAARDLLALMLAAHD
ncbi:unnamed protein product [Closterium sp. Naga37s-1]|nr:unnamed protein product [Closterium sp. Naga37s-1]